MSFFGVPLSGLIASQDQLQTVSNNLANISTDGYKDQGVTFTDLFAGASTVNGSGDPIQNGLGVTVSSTTSDFTDGATTATNLSSNMALTGLGFFETQQSDGTVDYTRAGDFTTNKAGNIVDTNGGLILGYSAVNGVVNPSSLGAINVGNGVTKGAVASTAFSLTANLGSGTAVGASFSSPVIAYDSLGTQQSLNVAYTNTSPGVWSYAVTMPTASVTSGGTGTTSMATGTLNFDASGVLTTTPTTISATSGTANLVDGAAPLTLAFDFSGLSGTSAANATNVTLVNGSASGTLSSYSITQDGTVEGTFTGGATEALGQVAVATFANLQGLARVGNNDYQVTAASGFASTGVAGSGGRGTITGGSVEGSNVDVAAEFAKMIVAQQAYQGDAKVVSTFSQISQATIAMVTA